MNINFRQLSTIKFGNDSGTPNPEDFKDVLENAVPYANFKGQFSVDSVVLEPATGDLIVTKGLSAPGGGAVNLRYKQDGSVQEEKNGPVVFPPQPPKITEVAPAGTISETVLDAVRKNVKAAEGSL